MKLTAYITARSPGTDAGGDKLLSDATTVDKILSFEIPCLSIGAARCASATSVGSP